MADWDTNNPDDNDIVSQYPSNERAARAAVVTNFGVDHHETDDADVGKHEVIQILDNAGDATIAAGQIGIWNDGGVLKTRVGAGQVKELGVADSLSAPSGTRMLFHQASPPTGWTQATDVNDRVLRVVSGATGGDNGGSWTISGLNVLDHTLTLSELPSHNHGGTRTTSTDSHSHSGTTSTDTHNHGGGDNLSMTIDVTGAKVARMLSGATTTGGNSGVDLQGFATDSDSHNHTFGTSTDSHNHTVTILSQGGGNGHDHGISHNGSWRPSHTDVIVGVKD